VRLPSIFEILQISAAIFDAVKLFSDKGTRHGVIHRIRIIPHPCPLEPIALCFLQDWLISSIAAIADSLDLNFQVVVSMDAFYDPVIRC